MIDGKQTRVGRQWVRMEVARTRRGRVIIRFPAPTLRVDLPPDQARDIAATLLRHADLVEQEAKN